MCSISNRKGPRALTTEDADYNLIFSSFGPCHAISNLYSVPAVVSPGNKRQPPARSRGISQNAMISPALSTSAPVSGDTCLLCAHLGSSLGPSSQGIPPSSRVHSAAFPQRLPLQLSLQHQFYCWLFPKLSVSDLTSPRHMKISPPITP